MDAHEFLGLEATHNSHRWYLPVRAGIATRERFLFGGCGLGAAIAALEAVAERPVVWATAQYLSFARVGEVMDIDVTIAVAGRYTTQGRVVARVGDREILTVNAALGRRELPESGQWIRPVDVPSPADSPEREWRFGEGESIIQRLETRIARGRQWDALDGSRGDGRVGLWIRLPGVEMSAAALAILGDYVPYGISQTLGGFARSNSLDNTIRVVELVPTEWVLLDIRILGLHHGFGHGTVEQYSENGRLLAAASQSVVVREVLDPLTMIDGGTR